MLADETGEVQPEAWVKKAMSNSPQKKKDRSRPIVQIVQSLTAIAQGKAQIKEKITKTDE